MRRTIRLHVGHARSAGPGAAHAAGLVLCLLPAAIALFPAAPAFGAASYTLLFQRSGYPAEYSATQATPLQHVDAFPVSSSGLGTTSFSGSAFAYPGHIGIVNRLETYWTGNTTASRYDVKSRASTNDFLITGPAGPWVAGALHLRVRASLAHVSGFAGNASHGSRVNVDARARFGALIAMGDLTSSNYDTHGTGVLAGVTDPELDFPFVLSGTYPVGTPFDIVLETFATETTYGNGGVVPNPGYVLGDAGSTPDHGLFLEEVGGQVMTLPDGYTLNSASWGVVDNSFHTVLGVGPAPANGAPRLTAYPNPFVGVATVSFDQPQAAHLRLQVFDVGGRLVRTLADRWHAAGTQRLEWDGRTDEGRVAGPGLYFLRAHSAGTSVSGRIVRIRPGN